MCHIGLAHDCPPCLYNLNSPPRVLVWIYEYTPHPLREARDPRNQGIGLHSNPTQGPHLPVGIALQSIATPVTLRASRRDNEHPFNGGDDENNFI